MIKGVHVGCYNLFLYDSLFSCSWADFVAQSARNQADKLKVSESLYSSLCTPKFNPLHVKAAKEAAAAAAARDQQLAKKATQAKQLKPLRTPRLQPMSNRTR
jgi:hypothetical protein